MTRQEKQRRAAKAELVRTMQAIKRNESELNAAHEPFYLEPLPYQHAALQCRCRALLRLLRSGEQNV